MEITKENIGTISLDEFVTQVSGIYKNKDEKRSIWDIWLHANHHAAAIGEEARKYEPGEKLFVEIADFAMWLFTLIGKIGRPLEKIGDQRIEESTIHISAENTFSGLIWNKYPGMCPVCFWRRLERGMGVEDKRFNDPCDCILYEVENRDQQKKREHVKKLRKYAENNKDSMLESVDEWQGMFRDIFEANLRHLSLVDIAFHLLEEVGEVCDAMIRMYTFKEEDFKEGEPFWRRINLEDEIADVASWMFTLVNHLGWVPRVAEGYNKYLGLGGKIKFEKITLSGIIWKRYGSDDLKSLYCPHDCKRPVCECLILLVQDEELLGKMKEYSIDVLKEEG